MKEEKSLNIARFIVGAMGNIFIAIGFYRLQQIGLEKSIIWFILSFYCKWELLLSYVKENNK